MNRARTKRVDQVAPLLRQSMHSIRSGFTLVELLVVISIIGVLVAIAIPTIRGAMERATVTTMKLEVASLSDAVERYMQQHGDYPPDFSSEAVIDRHYRKLFPRMATTELTLLKNFTGTGNSFNPVAIDRAEALVFCLGGYSKDVQYPFTGPGGPLVHTTAGNNSSHSQDINNFRLNTERVNSFMDWDLVRLGKVEDSGFPNRGIYQSSDDNDAFPTYTAIEDGAPFVYFDSRTYDHFATSGEFNGYASSFGAVRPYASDTASSGNTGTNYATLVDAIGAWQFMKPSTFQIISPGPDGNYGNAAAATIDVSGPKPVYFLFPSGRAFAPLTTASTPDALLITSVKGFKETSFSNNLSESLGLDNITSFSTGILADDVPE